VVAAKVAMATLILLLAVVLKVAWEEGAYPYVTAAVRSR